MGITPLTRNKLKFVVTGTGRSGTLYASRLFSAAGQDCGHELCYRVSPGVGETGPAREGRLRYLRGPVGRVRETRRRRQLNVVGDASWLAVPRLTRFDGTVLLQLRHPAKVVRSFVAMDFFTESRHHQYQSYALCFFDPTGDPVEDALRWWLFWNEWAAKSADVIYPLEGMNTKLLERILDRLEVPDPFARAAEAMASIPTNVNTSAERGDVLPQLNWTDLPESEAKDKVEQASANWGYDVTNEQLPPTLTLGLG